MKSKIRNRLREDSRPQSRSHQRISYTRVKTRPSHNDQYDQSVWNNSYKNIQPFSTKHSNSQDYLTVLRQNEQLKLQLIRLKSQLSKYQCEKQMSKISLTSITEQSVDESAKLKQIIEKSYYSLRQMQKDIKRLQNQLHLEHKSHQNTQKKMKIILLQKDQMQRKLNNMVSIHKEQIKICNQRINKLEGHLFQLIDHMQYDQKQWKKHMENLKNFKKFSFKRTNQ